MNLAELLSPRPFARMSNSSWEGVTFPWNGNLCIAVATMEGMLRGASKVNLSLSGSIDGTGKKLIQIRNII